MSLGAGWWLSLVGCYYDRELSFEGLHRPTGNRGFLRGYRTSFAGFLWVTRWGWEKRGPLYMFFFCGNVFVSRANICGGEHGDDGTTSLVKSVP